MLKASKSGSNLDLLDLLIPSLQNLWEIQQLSPAWAAASSSSWCSLSLSDFRANRFWSDMSRSASWRVSADVKLNEAEVLRQP